jgi:hypothetical protein
MVMTRSLRSTGITRFIAATKQSTPDRRIGVLPSPIVEAKDFSVYRVGLGTVQAYNTVTVKVRVDGDLIWSPLNGRTGVRLIDQGNIVLGSSSSRR